MRSLVLVVVFPALVGACSPDAGGDADAGDDAATDSHADTDTDTDTTDPFTGYDACVYVFTGWFTKADDCYGTSHWTAELIAMAQDFCGDSWSEWCDLSLALEDGQNLAYDCRMSIKVATCEEWELGTWIDSDACQLMTTAMGCDFPEE